MTVSHVCSCYQDQCLYVTMITLAASFGADKTATTTPVATIATTISAAAMLLAVVSVLVINPPPLQG